MKIGSQAHHSTAISTSNASTILVRGRDLSRELIGQISFTDHFWLPLAGTMPTPAQRRILDATLVAIAETQAAIEKRIAAGGIKPPATFVLEHGYCRSVYVTDPNGLLLEFTLDHPEADAISRDRRADARRELKRWLEGNHKSNNTYR